MGACLRTWKAKKTKLAKGKSIRLYEVIKKNKSLLWFSDKEKIKNVTNMKQAIWVKYFHLVFSNEHPMHELYTEG